MPLGYERLNERSQRPNGFINFIKPLTSSSPEDQKIAQDFLERIAAQCYPVMKKHRISVMALEEYAPNPEFLGRNFNAGECIQLVLKDKRGHWLSFRFVQMVMMHELAHCKQMNHSRFFWQVRNTYADQMKELWAKKYEGEGLWGRGQNLTSGAFMYNEMPDAADIPEHLCGGTYRTGRGKKRKRGEDGTGKPKVSYAERQQKRIAKKFGIHGEGHNLGEDELVRGALEQGNRRPGKPRVANSKRGRELRANAALARFDAAKKQQQQQVPEKMPELEEDEGSETESEDSDDEYADGLPILETLASIKDERGRDLYRVDDQGEQDEGAQQEANELRLMGLDTPGVDADDGASAGSGSKTSSKTKRADSETESEAESDDNQLAKEDSKAKREEKTNGHVDGDQAVALQSASDPGSLSAGSGGAPTQTTSNATTCPICTVENKPNSPTCELCSHVLKPGLMSSHWRCKSEACKEQAYINAGDAGRCGLCGTAKPAVESKPLGVTSGDVLRWD